MKDTEQIRNDGYSQILPGKWPPAITTKTVFIRTCCKISLMCKEINLPQTWHTQVISHPTDVLCIWPVPQTKWCPFLDGLYPTTEKLCSIYILWGPKGVLFNLKVYGYKAKCVRYHTTKKSIQSINCLLILTSSSVISSSSSSSQYFY